MHPKHGSDYAARIGTVQQKDVLGDSTVFFIRQGAALSWAEEPLSLVGI
jgi:hypothetical protein